MNENKPLSGRRRDLTKEMFEELGKVLCETPEILGYVGTTEEKLDRWCRKIYRMPLSEILPMIHQDGKVEIRKATFDAMRKNATLINHLYNRFLNAPAEDQEKEATELAKEVFSMLSPAKGEVEELFKE